MGPACSPHKSQGLPWGCPIRASVIGPGTLLTLGVVLGQISSSHVLPLVSSDCFSGQRVLRRECGHQRTGSGWSSLTTLSEMGSPESLHSTPAALAWEHPGGFCRSELPCSPGAPGFRCCWVWLYGIRGPERGSSHWHTSTLQVVAPALFLVQSHNIARS